LGLLVLLRFRAAGLVLVDLQLQRLLVGLGVTLTFAAHAAGENRLSGFGYLLRGATNPMGLKDYDILIWKLDRSRTDQGSHPVPLWNPPTCVSLGANRLVGFDVYRLTKRTVVLSRTHDATVQVDGKDLPALTGPAGMNCTAYELVLFSLRPQLSLPSVVSVGPASRLKPLLWHEESRRDPDVLDRLSKHAATSHPTRSARLEPAFSKSMSDATEEIHCPRHGATAVTYVCKHLQQGVGCGFHDAGGEDAWPDAWCDACQAVLTRDGAWTDDNGPELAMLCTGCYTEVRRNNMVIPASIQAGQLHTTDREYSSLVQLCAAWCCERQKRATALWAFDRKANWSFDSTAGTCRFFDPGEGASIVADAQLTGTFSEKTSTWLWAWANDGLEPAMRAGLAPIRMFGEVRSVRRLISGQWEAQALDGWEVTQIAAYLLNAEALYHVQVDHVRLFMLLNRFRIQP
jgi:hypothetical protein